MGRVISDLGSFSETVANGDLLVCHNVSKTSNKDEKLTVEKLLTDALGNRSVTITSGGSVGIGTTNPITKLHVNNSFRIGPDGSGSGSDTFLSGPYLYVGTTSGGSALQLNANNGLDFYVFGSSGWLKTLRLNTDYSVTIPVLGGNNIVGLSVNNDGTLIHTASDARMKTDVQAIEAADALAMVDALRPVRYRWNEEHAPSRGEQVEVGLIAQEVQAHVPEVIGESRDGMLSLEYARLTALLIGAVQALTARVAALEAAAAA